MSERVFRVGQRVRVVRSFFPERIGRVLTVTGEVRAFIPGPMSRIPGGTPVQDTDLIAPNGRAVAFPPAWLEPVEDDGREPTSWTESLRRLCGVKESA